MSGWHWPWTPVQTDPAVLSRLTALEQKEKGMATQADIDALKQRLSDVFTNIQAEIQSLQQANPSLDLSGLTDSVTALESLEMPPASPPAPSA